jgi:NAD(P)-dependent dehydrogenase (short-subunit alcohol dehydrogenase family)
MGQLTGRRIIVVGASRGLGRTFVDGLLAEGAHVAALARSTGVAHASEDRLRVAHCDVRDPQSCVDSIRASIDWLGGLDALIYAPGIAAVTKLADATPAQWGAVMETNVMGAGLVTAAAISELEKTEGVAVYFSSVSAHLTPPWIGMGLYAASKAALEKSVEVWKLEHPMVRFTTVIVGSTAGTSFFSSAEKPDPEILEGFRDEWQARGYLPKEQLAPDDQMHVLTAVLLSRAQIDSVWVRPKTQLQLWDRERG